MPMDSVCKENVDELKENAQIKLIDLTRLRIYQLKKCILDLQNLKSKL